MNTSYLGAVVAVLLSLLDSAVGQGTFLFANNSPTAITNFETMARADTQTKVAMYYSLNPNAGGGDPSFVLNTNAVTNLFTPGLFLGGLRSVPGVAAGTTIAVVIRAWSPPYATWEAQAANWACDPYPRGESQVFQLTLGTPQSPPSLTASGLKSFYIQSHLGTRICTPLVTVSRHTNGVALRINSNGSSGGYFRIESSASLATNSWQVRTNLQIPFSFPPGSSTNVTWIDSVGLNQPMFYRVRASLSSL
jgi:hypothetical protein